MVAYYQPVDYKIKLLSVSATFKLKTVLSTLNPFN